LLRQYPVYIPYSIPDPCMICGFSVKFLIYHFRCHIFYIKHRNLVNFVFRILGTVAPKSLHVSDNLFFKNSSCALCYMGFSILYIPLTSTVPTQQQQMQQLAPIVRCDFTACTAGVYMYYTCQGIFVVVLIGQFLNAFLKILYMISLKLAACAGNIQWRVKL